MSDIPKAIAESVLNVLGVDLKVYVLDDGRRIIEEQSMLAFFSRMADPDCPRMTKREAEVLAAFCTRGIETPACGES